MFPASAPYRKPRDLPPSVRRAREIATAILTAYSNILFLGEARLGLGVLLLTFCKPNVGVCGAVGALSGAGLAMALTPRASLPALGNALINAILTGLVLGTLTSLDAASLPLVILFCCAAFALALACQACFASHGIPVLSFPFSVVAALAHVAVPRYANLFLLRSGPAEVGEETAWHAVTTASGSLIAVPVAWVGAALLLLVLLRSRFAFFFAVGGISLGTFLESLWASPLSQAAHVGLAFNEMLTAIALGAVYLVPSLRGLIVAAIGVGVTVLVADALQALVPFPPFVFPFHFAVSILLVTLRTLGFRDFSERPDLPAEKSLDRHLSLTHRFRSDRIHLAPPLSGRWKVSQGSNGRHTHVAPWEHALDLVMVDGAGRTHQNGGRILTDYHSFGRQVLSPVYGHVVQAVSHLPDCLAGAVDTASPWGNHLVLRTLDGLHVVLAHLMKDSLLVKPGDYVSDGMPIACVGNSGYSPEPHLHVHVQAEPRIGSQTLPFRFVCHSADDQIVFSGLPAQDDVIELGSPQPPLDQRLSFILDSVFHVEREGGSGGAEAVRVAMEPLSGAFHLVDGDDNRLFLSKNRHYFCFFRYEGKAGTALEKLYAALPRVPLSARPGQRWKEILPLSLSHSWWSRWWTYALAAWIRSPSPRHAELRLADDGLTVSGTSYLNGAPLRVEVELDPTCGFARVAVGDRRYRVTQPARAPQPTAPSEEPARLAALP